MPKKGEKKQGNTSGKVELIQARGTFNVCPHGSLYCRKCYGFTTVVFSKTKKA